MADAQDALAALSANREALKKTSGYTGSYVGYRKRNGVRTEEVCIVVTVGQKLSSLALAARGLSATPSEVGGVPVDVQEATHEAQADDPNTYRPAPAGCSVGHKDITAGTLGAVLYRDTGAGRVRGILSNNHVLANTNQGAKGDLILQPGPYDQGKFPVGRLEEFIPIDFGGGNGGGGGGGGGFDDVLNCLIECLFGGAFSVDERRAMRRRLEAHYKIRAEGNVVDCAWAVEYDQGQLLREDILDIGPIGRTLVEGSLGLAVKKRGRTTRLTRGQIVGVNAEVQVQYGNNKVALFVDQLVIESNGGGDFSAGGDSGSLIVTDQEAHPVGLLFAGGGGQTIANRIQNVFDALPGLEIP